MSRHPHPLDEHALALGHLCIEWSYLQMYIDAFLFMLLNSTDADVNAAIGWNVDARKKLQIIKILAFKYRKSDEWFAAVDRLMNQIDNDLSARRNRMIHDIWSVGVTHPATSISVVRQAKRVLLQKPQAFEGTRLRDDPGVTVTPTDIYALVQQIKAAYSDLVGLLFDHTHASRSSPQK